MKDGILLVHGIQHLLYVLVVNHSQTGIYHLTSKFKSIVSSVLGFHSTYKKRGLDEQQHSHHSTYNIECRRLHHCLANKHKRYIQHSHDNQGGYDAIEHA